MRYKCLISNFYQTSDYSLIPLREEDIYLIKEWRNEQIDVLRQKKPLTDEDQRNYYLHHILPAFDLEKPSQIIFSFLKGRECIGYGGLTNIDWESGRIEMSFLVSTSRAKNEFCYINDFSSYITLIKEVVFLDLKFNRIFTETFDIRPLHVSVLERNGFVYEGRMREHVRINDKYYDSLLHGFIKSDYESKR
jgi:RimJ/RimL family protein N-acetyltransferase